MPQRLVLLLLQDEHGVVESLLQLLVAGVVNYSIEWGYYAQPGETMTSWSHGQASGPELRAGQTLHRTPFSTTLFAISLPEIGLKAKGLMRLVELLAICMV